MRRLLAAGAVAGCLTAVAAAAPFVVTGSRLDLDAQRGLLRAWQVKITDGKRVLTGQELVLDRAAGLGVLSGGVSGTGPEGRLNSRLARVRFTRQLELLAVEAEGQAQLTSGGRRLQADQVSLDVRTGVAVASGRPAILTAEQAVASGTRLVFRSREQRAEVYSPARFETPEGALQGREATFDLSSQTAILLGPVAFRFPSGRGTAQRAAADFRAGRVDLEGPVRMRWRGSVLEGRKVILWYRQGRVVVEGPSHMRVEEQDLPHIP